MRKLLTLAFCSSVLAGSAVAAETPIGKHQNVSGLEIGAVYLQPVKMEPEGMMAKAESTDIHLEADIHAGKDSKGKLSFAPGDWIPYLLVKYELQKVGSSKKIAGDMMAMVADDGPHYGDNVKLDGPGKYKMKLTVLPPSQNPHAHFGRHIDKETAALPWFKPFELNYEFAYAGTGKKGGY
jgi:uncharacterized protein involved in high-affinity Fe2+ transport